MAYEANFLTDKSVLVTVPIPVGETFDSNKLKYYFSNTDTNCLYQMLINRIRFLGASDITGIDNTLSKRNGTVITNPFPNTCIYFTLKDSKNNILFDSANAYDFSQPSTNLDGAGRKIYAPVRRTCAVVDWSKSYLTITTVTPFTTVVPIVIAFQVSYTKQK